ncbi:MAG: S-layer homology domain-containing protein, partial [Nitriliruptor sp.]|uniref:S-layer homology domain-containing protein n=1 Tax=Nitriliruptor sp. TaxID=2448056 RepID=UPI00349FE49C
DGSAEGSETFRGVRIFDISDLKTPVQVAAVQTCRGSHTHSLLEPPGVTDELYVYISGTAGVRTDAEGERLGCNAGGPDTDDPSRWRIDIIEVPIASPKDASLVSGPRVFADGEGNVDGLQNEPPAPAHPSGGPWLPSPVTDACHDITTYAELGLAAGACEGNGILLDISDPVNPRRVADVSDDNFAYWHSATFNDDGTKVVFTDEWGGGVFPYCQPQHSDEWGANGIYDIVDRGDGTYELQFASYYKIPNTQSAVENCVAHNGSLIPVPGRDVMAQAWYQGGMSIWEFTDSAEPVELGWFDRGPVPSPDGLPVAGGGGFWSTYWFNGAIYGTEIARGFDSFTLSADENISAAELTAAKAVTFDQINPQAQARYALGTPPGPSLKVCTTVDPVSFGDVTSGSTHAGNIGCVAGYGITRGTGADAYGPAEGVRRDQMATFLANALEVAGVELPTAPASSFTDIDGNTHRLAIAQLAELGVVKGRSTTTYDPSARVTRAQMASFLVNAIEFVIEGDLPAPAGPFTDTSGNTHQESIRKVAAAHIASGVAADRFAPAADVRRDQMASFLVRSLAALDREDVELAARG